MSIKKILLVFLITLPIISFAQSPSYVPLEPLPGTVTGTGCNTSNPFIPDPNDPTRTIPDPNCTTNVSTYLPSVFILLIALAGGLAVIMIVIGGIQYLSTDAVSGKSEGKQRIVNALVGLLLAIASYIILNTINPQTLKFNLTIGGTAPPPAPVTPPVVPPVPPGGLLCRANINGQHTTIGCTCPTCIIIGSSGQVPYNSIPLKNQIAQPSGSSSNMVSASLANLLNGLNATLRGSGVGWQVTEAWPPTYWHQAICHRSGTCIDANVTNSTTANIAAFYQAARAMGLRVVFESSSQSQINAVVNAGVPRTSSSQTSGALLLPANQITGSHFSVYFP